MEKTRIATILSLPLLTGTSIQSKDSISRVEFCRWHLHKYSFSENFIKFILPTVEAKFTRIVVNNVHRSQVWEVENPHFQHIFSINGWAGEVNAMLSEPYCLPNRLTGENNLDFLQNNLPLLLEDLPLNVRQNIIWLLHDGALPYFVREVHEHLNK